MDALQPILRRELTAAAPPRLLIGGPLQPLAGADDRCCDPEAALTEPFTRRYDLGVFWDEGRLAPGETRRLLARLRDLYCARVLAVAGPGAALVDANEWRALGYARETRLAGETALYVFDVRHYKPVPDWFNPKNWAHPELWDKYRW
ncbi:MAG: hypothetical protein KatS3mg121_1034 [Gammaproteobacteria bacterium]|nr:MAG: hypothetical protein KatS3mg121_1034 [Gammaproteobacteria bacterium]